MNIETNEYIQFFSMLIDLLKVLQYFLQWLGDHG